MDTTASSGSEEGGLLPLAKAAAGNAAAVSGQRGSQRGSLSKDCNRERAQLRRVRGQFLARFEPVGQRLGRRMNYLYTLRG